MNKYLEKIARFGIPSMTKMINVEGPKTFHIGSEESKAIYDKVKARLGPGPRVNDIYHQDIRDQISKWRESIPK